jgi:hypothetical protein
MTRPPVLAFVAKAVQIWIFVLFLIYTTAAELNALFGDGELRRISFERSTPNLKPPRPQRMLTSKVLRDGTGLAQAEQAGGAASTANRDDP